MPVWSCTVKLSASALLDNGPTERQASDMCGRFALTLPTDAMAQLFGSLPANDLMPVPNFNVCPTQNISVAVAGPEARRIVSMRWGFIPRWYKKPNGRPLLINARGETISQKPAFRSSVQTRRCLIPATGFYEWTKDADDNRLPWYITAKTDEPLVFGGLWRDWTNPETAEIFSTCAMVTTKANTQISQIHHRMPVVISAADFGLWLGEEGKGAARLMSGQGAGYFKLHRVDKAVNSNRASGPELIKKIEV
jgi:putative SOS response-associated peptidase YedK